MNRLCSGVESNGATVNDYHTDPCEDCGSREHHTMDCDGGDAQEHLDDLRQYMRDRGRP